MRYISIFAIMIGGGINMANAHQLIDCFNDTMHRIQTDPFLRAETMKSKADTVVYPVFGIIIRLLICQMALL